jgi:hypothetical protein
MSADNLDKVLAYLNEYVGERIFALVDDAEEGSAETPEPQPVAGFVYNVGATASFYPGYMMVDGGVRLFTHLQVGGNPMQPWLIFDVPRSQAVVQARDMVENIKRYAREMSPLVRPVEGLSLDDFVEHLRLRLKGGFH